MDKINIKIESFENIEDLIRQINEKIEKRKSYFIAIETMENCKDIICDYSGYNQILKVENSEWQEVIYWKIDDIIDNIIYISKRYRNYEKEKEDALNEWSNMSVIEKNGQFIADFMKQTGIENKEIISSIIDNIKQWRDKIDKEIAFKNIEFIKCGAKEFGNHIKLMNDKFIHSWAGGRGNIDEAILLYGNKETFNFGEVYGYEYCNNGNTTRDEAYTKEGNFNIKNTYVVLIENNDYSNYNNHCYDNTEYKCVAYIGNKNDYKFENNKIIEKYDLKSKI